MATKKADAGEPDLTKENPALESLLEADADKPDEPDAQNDGADDEGGDDGDDGSTAEERLLASLEERLSARFDAIADRRVNAILREVRSEKDGKKPDAKDQGQAAAAAADLRAARLSFREYVTDEVTFISSEERAFAMDLGSALILQETLKGGAEDEDVIGRTVAKDVATRIKALRAHYEKRTKDALRRRGALVDPEKPPTPGPASAGAGSEWQKGAELAAQMYGKA